MIATYASLALVVGGSLVIGRGVLALSGREEGWTLAGPVGLAAMLTVAGIAIHLPGRATTVAILLTLLFLLAVGSLALGRAGGRPPAWPAVVAGGLTLLAASIPFLVNGRIGILGVGLVNDDMASHLAIADWLWTHVGHEPELIRQGYPLGPHALAAALASGLGTGLIETFAGLTLAIPVLAAATAAGALRGLRPPARTVAAVAVALPYLAAAYLAQGAFKEPIMALLLLGFAILLPATRTPRAAIPLGLIATGAVYAYSFPGLAWLAGAALMYAAVLLAMARRRGGAGGGYRGPMTMAAVAIGVLVVLVLPEAGRIADFTGFRAFRSSALSGGLGNLRHQVSPLEAFGIWPASDFRLSAADASGPTAAFYLGALVALAAFATGLPAWLRRHGPAVPAAIGAAAVIYLGALVFGTVYTSAKALMIASPLIVLVALGGLLDTDRLTTRKPITGGAPRRALLRNTLALALIAGIALSSLLVLRQAPVAPSDHRDQLAHLRPLLQNRKVLFLGRDNFVIWELRGARPFVAVRNYYDRDYVKPNLALADVFKKFDFDSVPPRTLARFPFVVTTSAAYASGPPPGFEAVRRTADFVLWKRTGPVGPRRTLAEGASPGALLDCTTASGRRISRRPGTATVFARPPVAGGAWSPGSTVEGTEGATQTLTVPTGSWSVSLQYDATQPLRVGAPGLDVTLPANLDYRGSLPYFPAGNLTSRGGPVTFTVTVGRPPLAGRLLGAKSVAHLGTLALSPASAEGPLPGAGEQKVPLAHACGRYVDWYAPAGR